MVCILQKGELVLSTEVKEEEFKNKMKDFQEYVTLSEQNQKYYFQYFIEKAKSKQKEHKKKIKKAQKKMSKYLEEQAKDINGVFENVKEDIEKQEWAKYLNEEV